MVYSGNTRTIDVAPGAALQWKRSVPDPGLWILEALPAEEFCSTREPACRGASLYSGPCLPRSSALLGACLPRRSALLATLPAEQLYSARGPACRGALLYSGPCLPRSSALLGALSAEELRSTRGQGLCSIWVSTSCRLLGASCTAPTSKEYRFVKSVFCKHVPVCIIGNFQVFAKSFNNNRRFIYIFFV